MNFSLHIAKKVVRNPSHSFSKLIIRIAIFAVALGMTVMIVASSLIAGFKSEITHKIFGFWGHIHVMDFDAMDGNSYDSTPISTEMELYKTVTQKDKFKYFKKKDILGISLSDEPVEHYTQGGVSHIQSSAQKIGVIKTKEEIEGMFLKGISRDYNWENMEKFIKQGRKIDLSGDKPSREIMISEQTAKRLEIELGKHFLVYFVKGESQIKKRFKVVGIYKTGLEEYDARFALIDIRQIQKLNGWNPDEVSSFELYLDNLDDMDYVRDAIYDQVPVDIYVSTVKDVDPNIFGWLELQNVNERVILALMIIVGIINMITALLILILERTNMIGILKALGATNWTVQKIFLYYGAYIIIVGLLMGNILGLSLCFLQDTFGIITLPEEDYYVSSAPIRYNLPFILFLNIGTLLITVLFLIIPSFLVRFISPIKAIRFK